MLDPSTYRISGRRLVSRSEGSSWPSTSTRPDAVTVSYTAGYGSSADDVPARAKAAIKLILADLFEHRGDDDRRHDDFPMAVHSLLCSVGGVRYG